MDCFDFTETDWKAEFPYLPERQSQSFPIPLRKNLHVMLPLPGTAISRLQLLMSEEVANPLRKVPWPHRLRCQVRIPMALRDDSLEDLDTMDYNTSDEETEGRGWSTAILDDKCWRSIGDPEFNAYRFGLFNKFIQSRPFY